MCRRPERKAIILKNLKKMLLLLTAAVCCLTVTACGDKDDKSSVEVTSSSAEADVPENGDGEIIGKDDKSSTEETSSSAPVDVPENGVGEIIEPDADSQEADLGSYRYSSSGVKLYYDEAEYPTELVLSLERYFTSFEKKDFEVYKQCVYPKYIDEMNVFLERDFGYDIETSFNTQCDNLSANMGGEFTITRVKAEKPETEDIDAEIKEYFDMLGESFQKDFYKEVTDDVEDIHFMTFYIMARDTDGNESMLVSGFDIVFVEKDGKYYTFG